MKTIILECKDGVFAFSTKGLTIKDILDFEKQHEVVNIHYVNYKGEKVW